jgi:hypothetical protein
MDTARLASLLTISAVTLVLGSCATIGSDDCFCVTRHASGGKGAPLDTWVNFALPGTGTPQGPVAVAELTFLSIRGSQGIQVEVCNQPRKLTATAIDDLGPDLFAVPPGCAIQTRCGARDGVSGGCEADYRFRWLD